MELRERHIGPITTRSGEDESDVRVDAGALVRRLLLFEHCTLESDGLVEIPRLVKVFGFRGLMELLESGALSIVCDWVTMGNTRPKLPAIMKQHGARVPAVSSPLGTPPEGLPDPSAAPGPAPADGALPCPQAGGQGRSSRRALATVA